jgi:predicted DNA-binding transcriptional regulator YafY
MNRIDRLTAILTHLQSRRVVKAQDIADRFEISLRTVYRDVRALEEAGVPILGEAGIGYSIMEGYRLPPVMFTTEEAMALLMAGKLVAKVADTHSSKQFESALYKVKAVLKSAEKEVLEDVSQNIEVIRRRNSLQTEGKEDMLQMLMTAAANRKVVVMDYTSFEQEHPTRREIEPVGIYYAWEQWYLIAWCRLRQDYRTFRVDRIEDMWSTKERFPGRHPSLQEYLEKVTLEESLTRVVIRVDTSATKYLREHKYHMGFVMETEGPEGVDMVFMNGADEGFARWLLMMGDKMHVLEPESLREQLLRIWEKTGKRIQNS